MVNSFYLLLDKKKQTNEKTRIYNSTGLGLILYVKCKKVEKRSGGKITLNDMFSDFAIIELN